MDYEPVITYCETRIRQIRRHAEDSNLGGESILISEDRARLTELQAVINVCKGLGEVECTLRKQLGLVETI